MRPPYSRESADLFGPFNEVEAKYAPPRLHLLGDLDVISSGPRVAIVGSRKASAEGLRRATKLAHELAREGVVVVSGLAMGIDGAAHRGSIDGGGQTIAVLGTPLDQPPVKANREIAELMREEHLLLSQFDSGSFVRKSNFPARNRTMALICQASVIVEAGDGSGTLSQGWEALRLGRTLFIMRSVFSRTDLDWPKQLLDYGAQILDKSEEVLNELPTTVNECLDHAF